MVEQENFINQSCFVAVTANTFDENGLENPVSLVRIQSFPFDVTDGCSIEALVLLR